MAKNLFRICAKPQSPKGSTVIWDMSRDAKINKAYVQGNFSNSFEWGRSRPQNSLTEILAFRRFNLWRLD